MRREYSSDIPGILIIDDVTSNLVVLTEIIREAGYIARPVTSVKQAKQAINAALPDIILLDVTMPDVNGYEYCVQLKKSSVTRDIPVIFISALNSSKDRIKGFECGAVDFISKPFEKAEVLVRMNTHLKLHAMQTELERSNRRLNNLVGRQLYQISEERKNMVCALAKLIEARDDSQGTHTDNVSKNCRLIAMGLQLTHKFERVITNEFINIIEMASQLHDIGKIAVPDSILLKPGELTAEELEVVKTHAAIGADTIKEIYTANEKNEFLKMAMDIARYHHEKWDGTGYPCGLSGTDIPLAARIMAVVDTYDALVSERCYKPAYSHEFAIDTIKNESGKSFDPDIVNIFCRLSRKLKRNEGM